MELIYIKKWHDTTNRFYVLLMDSFTFSASQKLLIYSGRSVSVCNVCHFNMYIMWNMHPDFQIWFTYLVNLSCIPLDSFGKTYLISLCVCFFFIYFFVCVSPASCTQEAPVHAIHVLVKPSPVVWMSYYWILCHYDGWQNLSLWDFSLGMSKVFRAQLRLRVFIYLGPYLEFKCLVRI